MHTGKGVVERAIQLLKNIIIANMENGLCLTESVNRALRVMRFTIHTRPKITPFELHHGRKPRTELTNNIRDGKTYMSSWSEKTVSAPERPKIPIYLGLYAEGEITNHIIMAKTKNEEKQTSKNIKSPKKKNSVRYPFPFVEKNCNKKSLEGRFQNKIQTTISGTESTVKTDTGKINKRKFISLPLCQTGRKTRKEPAINTNGEFDPKNRYCLRGLDDKYGRWDGILCDILNGKLKIVHLENQREATPKRKMKMMMTKRCRKKPEHQHRKCMLPSNEADDEPIGTNPEDDALQLHTDGEISGENLETNITRSSRDSKNRIDTEQYHVLEIFGVTDRMTKKHCVCYRKSVDPNKGNTTAEENPKTCGFFYQKKEHPQDPQTKIEKKKRKRGKCYIRVHSGPRPYRDSVLKLQTSIYMSRVHVSVDKYRIQRY